MENIKNLLIQNENRLEIKEHGIIVKNPNREEKNIINEKTKDFIKIKNGELDILIKNVEIIRFLFEKLVKGINMNDYSDEEIEFITDNPSPLMKKINNAIIEILYDITIDKLDEFSLKLKELELISKVGKMGKNIDNFTEKTGIEIPEFDLEGQVVEDTEENLEEKILRLTEEMNNEKDIKKRKDILSKLTKLYEEVEDNE